MLVEGFTTLDHVSPIRCRSGYGRGTIKERYNARAPACMGINIEGKAFTRWFDLQARITLQQSRYKEPEQWANPEVAPTRRCSARRTPTATLRLN